MTSGGGAVASTPAAAFSGLLGFEATAGPGDKAYLLDLGPTAEKRYSASFRLNTDAAVMSVGNKHTLFTLRDDDPTAVLLKLQIEQTASGRQLIISGTHGSGVEEISPGAALPAGWNLVEVEWWGRWPILRASGGYRLRINGTLVAEYAFLENPDHGVDRALLGIFGGVDAGSSGSVYFDDFDSRRCPAP